MSFEIRERMAGRGVFMRAVWVIQRERESERDAQLLPKQTFFLVWMPVEFSNNLLNQTKYVEPNIELNCIRLA